MNRISTTFLALLCAGFYMGCDREERVDTTPTDGPAERTGEQIDRAAERTGETIERAADRTGEAIDRTAERTGESMDRAVEGTGEAMERTGEKIERAGERTADAARDTAADAQAEARVAGERVGDDAANQQIDHDQIHGRLAETVEAAVKVGTFNDLIERFAPQDRQRFEGLGADTLNAEAQPFNNAWQSKFGDFDIDNPAQVFEQLVRIEAAGNNQARVHVQAQGNLPEFTLNMIRENNAWFIDIPDTSDRESLRTALATHLRTLNDQQANLGADEVEAQRHVAHRVLAGLANTGIVGAPQLPENVPAGGTGTGVGQ